MKTIFGAKSSFRTFFHVFKYQLFALAMLAFFVGGLQTEPKSFSAISVSETQLDTVEQKPIDIGGQDSKRRLHAGWICVTQISSLDTTENTRPIGGHGVEQRAFVLQSETYHPIGGGGVPGQETRTIEGKPDMGIGQNEVLLPAKLKDSRHSVYEFSDGTVADCRDYLERSNKLQTDQS